MGKEDPVELDYGSPMLWNVLFFLASNELWRQGIHDLNLLAMLVSCFTTIKLDLFDEVTTRPEIYKSVAQNTSNHIIS